MAKLLRIELINFKGATNVSIDLDGSIGCPVVTLIGLNESGKTTILEGMSHFTTGDRAVSGLFEGSQPKFSGTNLVPVHLKAAFSSAIQIVGHVELDDADIKAIHEACSELTYFFDESSIKRTFTVIREYMYQDSSISKSMNYWDLRFKAKKNKSGRLKEVNDPSHELWLKVVKEIERRLPKIAYFPTFLVDMPARIYLKEHANERAVNRFYRIVIQDVLDSLGEHLSLEKHVCERIAKVRGDGKDANWFSLLFNSPVKTTIDSVFQKIANAVTKEVLGSWKRVFHRRISAKNILVEWNVDAEKDNLPYLSFYIYDGESRYAISERSMGFRWFFSFLLFTAFKQANTNSTIFLFDEPAANLHAKAQAELLTSFARIATNGNQVIYSTHSHHMINPEWLVNAYIIDNKALDYDDDSLDTGARPTEIQATKYRRFVGEYPSRTSYFQPVLDRLDYVPPAVQGGSPFLVVEGITDYYALKLAIKESKRTVSFSIIPGAGAGSTGPLLSFLIGKGEQFAVLLDDDKEGRRQQSRYFEKWFLDESEVKTLGDVDVAFCAKCIEGLLCEQTMANISALLGLDTVPSKKQIGAVLAECCALDSTCLLGQVAIDNFSRILEYFELRFEDC